MKLALLVHPQHFDNLEKTELDPSPKYLLVQAIMRAEFHVALNCLQDLVAILGFLLQSGNKVTQGLVFLVVEIKLGTLVVFLFQTSALKLGLFIVRVQCVLEILKLLCTQQRIIAITVKMNVNVLKNPSER